MGQRRPARKKTGDSGAVRRAVRTRRAYAEDENQSVGRVYEKQWVKSAHVTRASGLVFGVTGPQGGISVNPATSFSRYFRKRLLPINIATTTVMNAEGTVIAYIDVDPVTGKRTRRPA